VKLRFNLDFLVKGIRLHECARLQIRAGAFGTFGAITSPLIPGRCNWAQAEFLSVP
jgi:hypothetical protein